MAPLHGQTPLGDDSARPGWRPKGTGPEATTEPGFALLDEHGNGIAKVPLAWLKGAWERGRPLVLAALLAGGSGFGFGKASGDPATPKKVEAIEARVAALETALAKIDGKLDVLINRGGK